MKNEPDELLANARVLPAAVTSVKPSPIWVEYLSVPFKTYGQCSLARPLTALT